MDLYRFVHVDRSATEHLPTAAANYKALRLQALQESPHAFASTFDMESQFSDQVWLSRLCQPRQETFACILPQADGTAEWVAQVTIRGPLTSDEFHLPPESGQTSQPADAEADKWHMLSLYTAAGHRRRGLGPRLCREAFQHLEQGRGESSAPARSSLVRIMVKPDNVATLRLYGELGFVETARCTLAEALRANGDGDLLPEEPLGEKYTTRSGIVMALVLSRTKDGL